MKKALLAADASPASLRAAQLLGEMASRDPDLSVTILHVAPLPDVLTPAAAAGAPLTLPDRMDEYLNARVPEVLRMAKNALGLPGERVRLLHVVGNPADALLTEAREGSYDLVVMGRRGLSPLKELILGSVSQAVLHKAHCPVFIVP